MRIELWWKWDKDEEVLKDSKGKVKGIRRGKEGRRGRESKMGKRERGEEGEGRKGWKVIFWNETRK